MDMKTIKSNIERVVKVIKGPIDEQEPFYTVVDEEDNEVKVFSKQDYGPRAYIKANQYANNNSSEGNRLTVREFGKRVSTKKDDK